MVDNVFRARQGGTGNKFTKFTGATTSEKTYTLPNANATLLHSGGALGTPSSGTLTNCSGLPDSGLSLTDVTTNNVSTTKHGFAPKGDGDTTKFLNANGAYSIPSAIPSGGVVQIVNYQTGAVATGSGTIPADDTIPQNTEGNEYMSLAITPTSSSNKLLIQICFQGSNSATFNTQVVALFQDSTAGALTCGQMSTTTNNNTRQTLQYYMTAGTTSSTTFKVRAGGVVAGTTSFNGDAGSRLYGGVFNSSITITEIKN